MHAYYRTTDNTIAHQELERFDSTSGTYGAQIAFEFAKAFGFELLEYGPREWESIDWEENYTQLEERGFYTAERRAELFDEGLTPWELELLTGTDQD